MTAAPLKLWGREYGPFASAFAKQSDAFVAKGGTPVEAMLIEISDLEHRLLEGDLATSGEADVLLLNTDWIPRCLERGLLQPIDDGLQKDPPAGWPDAWSPSLLELQTNPDGIFALPYHDGPMMVLYRRDLFEDPRAAAMYEADHGVPLRPPLTWDELVVQAHFFNSPERGRWGTILAGQPDAHNNVYDFLTQLWGRGGDVLDATGRPALTGREPLAAAAWLADLWHRQGVIDPAARRWDSVASGIHFAAGEAALMVNWCGFASLAADPSSPVRGRLGCAPVPAVAGGTQVTMNSYWVLAIPVGSRHAEQAWQFIRHVASPEMDRITATEGATAVRRDTWSDPAVQELAPYYEQLEAAHSVSRSVWRDPRWPTVADILNDALADLVVERAAPEACIERAASRLADLDERKP